MAQAAEVKVKKSFVRKAAEVTVIMVAAIFVVAWVSMMVDFVPFLENCVEKIPHWLSVRGTIIVVVLGILLARGHFNLEGVLISGVVGLGAVFGVSDVFFPDFFCSGHMYTLALTVLVFATSYHGKGYIVTMAGSVAVAVATLSTAQVGFLLFGMGLTIIGLVDLGLKLHQRRKNG